MSRQSGFIPVIVSALALLLGAHDALATGYTIPLAVHMDDGNGNVLDILPVFDETGSTICLGGSCAGPDFLIFDVLVTSGTFEEILAVALVVAPQDLGYFTDSQTTPSTGSISGGGGQFDFDAPNLNGASDRLFVSYVSLAAAGSTSFSATPTTDPLFSRPGGIVLIPEPSTLTLSALGLAALAAGRRRRD